MKVEQSIKQTKPFKSEFQKLVVNIQVTAGWFNSSFAKILKPFNITPPQYNVLRILKGKYPEGYCNQEITERMMDKSSNSTRIVDKLLTKKLISRNEHKTDRRLVDIKINQKGLDLIKEIDLASESFRNKAKLFNEEKAKLMNEWLDEIRKD